MRILVCGSREWDDPWSVNVLLLGMAIRERELTVIEGEARGADSIARHFAEVIGEELTDWGIEVDVEPYPAEWDKYGKAAGRLRNQRMLDEGKPDVVIAFTDNFISSRGTRDMVQRAKDAGITAYVIGRVQ